MPLLSPQTMLVQARNNHFAIPAFNVDNMEIMQAIVMASHLMKSPTILQTAPSTLGYFKPEVYQRLAETLAMAYDVEIALHLDHGNNLDQVTACIHAGYTSLMIDASALAFETNIEITKKAVLLATPHHIPVEGELGIVGTGGNPPNSTEQFTSPDAAAEYVMKTGVSSLAVAIGCAHGKYAKAPMLDFARLREISKSVSVPLVLHGASGLSDDAIKTAIQYGICKINFATDVRQAFTDGVKNHFTNHPDSYDPKQYLREGRDSLINYACSKMRLCGSVERDAK